MKHRSPGTWILICLDICQVSSFSYLNQASWPIVGNFLSDVSAQMLYTMIITMISWPCHPWSKRKPFGSWLDDKRENTRETESELSGKPNNRVENPCKCCSFDRVNSSAIHLTSPNSWIHSFEYSIHMKHFSLNELSCIYPPPQQQSPPASCTHFHLGIPTYKPLFDSYWVGGRSKICGYVLLDCANQSAACLIGGQGFVHVG